MPWKSGNREALGGGQRSFALHAHTKRSGSKKVAEQTAKRLRLCAALLLGYYALSVLAD